MWALRGTEAPYPPGQRYHYSNVGYKALGLLLERVTGEPYGAIVQQGILDPLGMTMTDPSSRTRRAPGSRWATSRSTTTAPRAARTRWFRRRGSRPIRATNEYSPERLRFDTIVDGYALRARASNCEYYRFFTP